MCTVTIVPTNKNDFVLVSNRDEAPNRISLPPENKMCKDTLLMYPEDKESGGTWIGVSEKNRLICLLNGGFEIHKRKPNYRHSRGIVVKDLLVSDAFQKDIEEYNLIDIEPFTLVIADWNENLNFYEFVWDGEQKYFKQLPLEPRIWSSSTLYNDAMKKERQQWFKDYIEGNNLNDYSMFVFHTSAGKGNEDYGVIMDRQFVKTTSITRFNKEGSKLRMNYFDLLKDKHYYAILNSKNIEA